MIKKMKEKLLKNELTKKIVFNSSWMMAQNIYSMIIGIFVTAIVSRFYGPEGYGTINYVIAFVGIFSGLAVFGTNHIAIKDFTQKKYPKEKVFGTILIIRIIFSLIVFVVSQTIMFIIFPNDHTLQIITLLFNIKTVVSCFDIITYYANSKINNKLISKLKIVSLTIFSVLKVLCVILQLNIVFLAGTYLVEAVIYSLLLLLSKNKIDSNDKFGKLIFDKVYAKEVIKQSKYYALASIMVTIYLKIDQVMLGSMLPNKEIVGIYSAAVVIAEMWVFIPNAIISTIKPLIISYKEESKEKYLFNLQKLYYIISIINFIFVALMILFGKLAIYILYGNKYITAYIPMCIILVGITFGVLGNIHYIWMICEKKEKYSTFYSFFGCFSNIIINALLIPKYGMIGAAIATLISQIMSNVVAFLFFKDAKILSKMLLKSLNIIKGIKVLESDRAKYE